MVGLSMVVGKVIIVFELTVLQLTNYAAIVKILLTQNWVNLFEPFNVLLTVFPRWWRTRWRSQSVHIIFPSKNAVSTWALAFLLCRFPRHVFGPDEEAT